jgi:hypothetical protein
LLCESILGFNYEKGNEYEIIVNIYDIDYGSAGCLDDCPQVKYELVKIVSQGTTKSIEVTIKNSETYLFDTKMGGDEQGAKINKQPSNFEISEIKRNKSTNWQSIYYYKPKANFIGTDYVEIKTTNYIVQKEPYTKLGFIKIIINVTQ